MKSESRTAVEITEVSFTSTLDSQPQQSVTMVTETTLTSPASDGKKTVEVFLYSVLIILHILWEMWSGSVT